MTISEVEQYEGHTVKIEYLNPRSKQIDKRTGIIVAITIKRIAFLLADDDEDIEIMIPIDNVKKLTYV